MASEVFVLVFRSANVGDWNGSAKGNFLRGPEEWLSIDHKIETGIFSKIKNSFDSPEPINDSPQTAPSKRIINTAPSYNKVAEGVTIVEVIGLAKIRKEGAHFNSWVCTIENIAIATEQSEK